MRSLFILFFAINANLLFAREGHVGGNGGDAYVDEFKEYQELVVRIFEGEANTFRSLLKLSDEKYRQLIAKMSQIQLLRNGALEHVVDRWGNFIEFEKIYAGPLTNLFIIDMAAKMAVNFSTPEVEFIIFSEKEWDELEGNVLRRLKLMTHELMGVVGIESTNQVRISRFMTKTVVDKYYVDPDLKDKDGNLLQSAVVAPICKVTSTRQFPKDRTRRDQQTNFKLWKNDEAVVVELHETLRDKDLYVAVETFEVLRRQVKAGHCKVRQSCSWWNSGGLSGPFRIFIGDVALLLENSPTAAQSFVNELIKEGVCAPCFDHCEQK